MTMPRALVVVLSLVLSAPAPAAPPEGAPLQARWRGTPRVKLQAGPALPLPPAIARRDSLRPLSLATADLNRDGAPDLVAGYAAVTGGVLHVYTGNLQAFAPGDDAVYRAIQDGFMPPVFRPEVEAIQLPEPPDFLALGDVDGDGSPDVVAGARGGSAYVLAGDPAGRLAAPRAIPLDGRLTALAVGQVGQPDLAAEIVLGASTPSGPALLVRDGARDSWARLALPAEASDLSIGNLTDDLLPDVAAAAGPELFVVPGRTSSPVDESSFIERIALPLASERLALGDFLEDAEGRLDIAVLLADGQLAVLAREGTERDALSSAPEPSRASLLRERAGSRALRESEVVPRYTLRRSGTAISLRPSRAGSPFLTRSRVSGGGDEILGGDALGERLHAVSAASGEATLEIETGGEPIAAVELPSRVNGERDILVLRAGSVAPAAITLAPLATFVVDRTDDTAAASACTAAPNDCSLRGAILAANATAGPHTITVPAGFYGLTVAGSGEDMGMTGDLDVRTSFTTIQGAGAASTVIQWNLSVPLASRDRVLEVNPALTPGFFFALNGVTLSMGWTRGHVSNLEGAGMQIWPATASIMDSTISFSEGDFGGGGMNLEGLGMNASFNVVNSQISRNGVLIGDGGGIRFEGYGTDTLILIGTSIVENAVRSSLPGVVGGGGLFVATGGTVTATRCDLSGNSHPTAGGGFSQAAGSLSIAFSRVARNTPTTSVVGAGLTATLNDNWWGRSSSPLVTGNSPATWLQLRHAPSAPSVPGFQAVTLTADILGRNAGGPIASASLAGLPAFPLMPVTIFGGAVNGSLSSAATQVVNGQAQATFTPTCGTPATADATVDLETATASVTTQCPDLSLFTSGTGGTTCGSGVSYLIQVENFGTAAAANVTLTHALPACLTSVACTVDTGPGTCTVGAGNLVTATFASIGAGGQRVIIVSGTLPSAAPGCPSFDSLMSVSTPTPEVSTLNNSLLFHTDVACADLSLAKSAPAAVTAGGTLTYTLTSTNQGAVAAQNVAIADPLPAGLRFVSATASGATLSTPAAGGTGTVTATWAGPTGPGASRALTIVARACSDLACGTPVVNAATTSTSTYDTNPANDSASATTLVEARSDLSISMSHAPDPVAAGAQTTYTIVVTNAGPSADAGPTVTDALPAGWTVASVSVTSGSGTCSGAGTGTASCALGPLGAPGACGAAPPATATITLVVNVPVTAGPGTVINAASVASGNCQPDPDASDNVANDPTLVTIVSDMAIAKLDSQDPVAASRDLTYTLKVENLGPSRAYGVVVSDPLPSGVRYRRVIAPAGWTCSAPYPGTAGTVSCSSAAPLMPGTYSIGIVVTTPAVCGRSVTLTNTATVTSTSHDPDGTNNVSSQSTLVTGGPCFLSLPPGGSSDPEPM